LEISVAALIAVRFLELVANLVMCLKVIPKPRRSINIHGEQLKSILSFGGWITISNVVGSLITYMDRFLIGALISISAVAYYTTTYEIVMRLMIIPGAVVGVMYPAFAATFNNNRDRSKEIYFKGVKYTLLMISPIILVLVTLANEGLLVWLGNEFASNSTTVLKLLAIGALINSQSYIPSALIQASGRPDLTAKLYFIELPIYLFLLIEMVNAHGIEGAAMTWVVRVTAEAIILSIIAFRLLKVTKISGNNCLLIVVFAIMLIVSAITNISIVYKIIFLIVVLHIFGYISWSRILDPEERSFVSKKIAQVFFH
jgi:O-antigen/teichoic acid export membrane protein